MLVYGCRSWLGIGLPSHPRSYILLNLLGKKANPMGHIPFEVFLTCDEEVDYLENASDVSEVQGMVCKQVILVEFADMILDGADYVPRRRLPIPHDPLHPDNGAELNKYLDYCWQLNCQL